MQIIVITVGHVLLSTETRANRMIRQLCEKFLSASQSLLCSESWTLQEFIQNDGPGYGDETKGASRDFAKGPLMGCSPPS